MSHARHQWSSDIPWNWTKLNSMTNWPVGPASTTLICTIVFYDEALTGADVASLTRTIEDGPVAAAMCTTVKDLISTALPGWCQCHSLWSRDNLIGATLGASLVVHLWHKEEKFHDIMRIESDMTPRKFLYLYQEARVLANRTRDGRRPFETKIFKTRMPAKPGWVEDCPHPLHTK